LATKLGVFNDALLILTQGVLDNPDPSPSNERSRVLNANWVPAVEACLERADWDFAEERAQLARVTPAPAFGFSYYYGLPTDCLRVTFVSETGIEGDDLLNYKIEKGKIATDAETLYLKYVSSTAISYPGRWSSNFARYVSAELAFRSLKLNSSAEERAKKELKEAKSDAVGVDAVQNPPTFRKPGQWVQAARTGRRGTIDGGPTSSFN